MQVIAHKPNKNHGGGCRCDCDRKDSSKCPFFHQENLHESFRSHIKERTDMKHGIFVGNFSSAMECLKCGEPIKRPGWIGYWIIRNGKLEMHCKDGSILVNQVNDVMLTLENASKSDWYAMSEGEREELDAIHMLVRESGKKRLCKNKRKRKLT